MKHATSIGPQARQQAALASARRAAEADVPRMAMRRNEDHPENNDRFSSTHAMSASFSFSTAPSATHVF